MPVLMLSWDNSMGKEGTEVRVRCKFRDLKIRILVFYMTAFVDYGNNIKVKLKA